MATATAWEFQDDYTAEDIARANAELELLANQAHSPVTTEEAAAAWGDLSGRGGLAVAVRGVGHYGPERRSARFMERRNVLGGYAVLGRELPKDIYGTNSPLIGPDNFID